MKEDSIRTVALGFGLALILAIAYIVNSVIKSNDIWGLITIMLMLIIVTMTVAIVIIKEKG